MCTRRGKAAATRRVLRDRRAYGRRGQVDHDEMRDLIPVFVIGALPAEERREVVGHLHDCHECCLEGVLLAEAAVAVAKSAYLGDRRPPRA